MYVRERVPVTIHDDIARSPALMAAVDKIAAGIPGSTAARFDILFKNHLELEQGKFKILEVDLAPWGDRREKDFQSDDNPKFYAGWRNSARQARSMAMHIYIGVVNVMMGYSLDPLNLVIEMTKLVERATRCGYDGSMSPVTPGLV